jgi:hypothetical protein
VIPVLGHLQRQLESARRLLGIVLAQGEAIRRRDVESVLARLTDVQAELAERRRLELEREELENERARADRALRLERWRHAGEREIARLRLVAGVAVVSWLGTLFFSTRIVSGGGAPGGRVALALGWALLLAALAAAFAAQTRVATALDRIDETTTGQGAIESGLVGTFAPWLIIAGLAVVGVAVLIV